MESEYPRNKHIAEVIASMITASPIITERMRVARGVITSGFLYFLPDRFIKLNDEHIVIIFIEINGIEREDNDARTIAPEIKRTVDVESCDVDNQRL